MLTENTLTCCPPGCNDIFTFVHCAQAALAWTLAIMAIVEVTTIMVFMAPKVYYGIKDKGRAEGREEGVDDTLAAMREAGVDEETRRRVEDTIFRRARRSRNGK